MHGGTRQSPGVHACRLHLVKEYLEARFSSLPDRYFISTTVKGFVDDDDGCGGGDSKYVSQSIVSLLIPCTKGQ